MSVDFPAPDGPIIAVTSPARNPPLTSCRTCLFSETIINIRIVFLSIVLICKKK